MEILVNMFHGDGSWTYPRIAFVAAGGIFFRSALSSVVGAAATTYIIAAAMFALYAYARFGGSAKSDGAASAKRSSKNLDEIRASIAAQKRALQTLRRPPIPIDKHSMLPLSMRNDSAFPLPERDKASRQSKLSAPRGSSALSSLPTRSKSQRVKKRQAKNAALTKVRRSKEYIHAHGLARHQRPGAPSKEKDSKTERLGATSSSLQDFVKRAGLDEDYAQKLHEIGAQSVKHLEDVYESDLSAMGMKTLEIRRFMKAVAERKDVNNVHAAE